MNNLWIFIRIDGKTAMYHTRGAAEEVLDIIHDLEVHVWSLGGQCGDGHVFWCVSGLQAMDYIREHASAGERRQLIEDFWKINL